MSNVKSNVKKFRFVLTNAAIFVALSALYVIMDLMTVMAAVAVFIIYVLGITTARNAGRAEVYNEWTKSIEDEIRNKIKWMQ